MSRLASGSPAIAFFEAKSGDGSHLRIGVSSPSWIASAWRLDASPRRQTFGTAQDERPAVASLASPAGLRRLAFASVSHKEDVWSVALDTNRPGSGSTLTQLTHGTTSHVFPSVSADGTKLTYITHAAYNDQVSLLDVKTGKTSLLSATVSTKFRVRIRRDGSEVFFGDRNSGLVYAVRASGGPPEPICDKCGSWPWDWSPDRRWLLVNPGRRSHGRRRRSSMLRRRPLASFLSDPNEDLFNFEVSPDGRWIVFRAQAAESVAHLRRGVQW